MPTDRDSLKKLSKYCALQVLATRLSIPKFCQIVSKLCGAQHQLHPELLTLLANNTIPGLCYPSRHSSADNRIAEEVQQLHNKRQLRHISNSNETYRAILKDADLSLESSEARPIFDEIKECYLSDPTVLKLDTLFRGVESDGAQKYVLDQGSYERGRNKRAQNTHSSRATIWQVYGSEPNTAETRPITSTTLQQLAARLQTKAQQRMAEHGVELQELLAFMRYDSLDALGAAIQDRLSTVVEILLEILAASEVSGQNLSTSPATLATPSGIPEATPSSLPPVASSISAKLLTSPSTLKRTPHTTSNTAARISSPSVSKISKTPSGADINPTPSVSIGTSARRRRLFKERDADGAADSIPQVGPQSITELPAPYTAPSADHRRPLLPNTQHHSAINNTDITPRRARTTAAVATAATTPAAATTSVRVTAGAAHETQTPSALPQVSADSNLTPSVITRKRRLDFAQSATDGATDTYNILQASASGAASGAAAIQSLTGPTSTVQEGTTAAATATATATATASPPPKATSPGITATPSKIRKTATGRAASGALAPPASPSLPQAGRQSSDATANQTITEPPAANAAPSAVHRSPLHPNKQHHSAINNTDIPPRHTSTIAAAAAAAATTPARVTAAATTLATTPAGFTSFAAKQSPQIITAASEGLCSPPWPNLQHQSPAQTSRRMTTSRPVAFTAADTPAADESSPSKVSTQPHDSLSVINHPSSSGSHAQSQPAPVVLLHGQPSSPVLTRAAARTTVTATAAAATASNPTSNLHSSYHPIKPSARSNAQVNPASVQTFGGRPSPSSSLLARLERGLTAGASHQVAASPRASAPSRSAQQPPTRSAFSSKHCCDGMPASAVPTQIGPSQAAPAPSPSRLAAPTPAEPTGDQDDGCNVKMLFTSTHAGKHIHVNKMHASYNPESKLAKMMAEISRKEDFYSSSYIEADTMLEADEDCTLEAEGGYGYVRGAWLIRTDDKGVKQRVAVAVKAFKGDMYMKNASDVHNEIAVYLTCCLDKPDVCKTCVAPFGFSVMLLQQPVSDDTTYTEQVYSIIMERAQGNLKQLCAELANRTYPSSQIRLAHHDKLMMQILQQIAAIQKTVGVRLGLMHRDIKPSNIMFYGTPRDFSLKIADFGLARRIPELRSSFTYVAGSTDRHQYMTFAALGIAPRDVYGLPLMPITATVDTCSVGILVVELRHLLNQQDLYCHKALRMTHARPTAVYTAHPDERFTIRRLAMACQDPEEAYVPSAEKFFQVVEQVAEEFSVPAAFDSLWQERTAVASIASSIITSSSYIMGTATSDDVLSRGVGYVPLLHLDSLLRDPEGIAAACYQHFSKLCMALMRSGCMDLLEEELCSQYRRLALTLKQLLLQPMLADDTRALDKLARTLKELHGWLGSNSTPKVACAWLQALFPRPKRAGPSFLAYYATLEAVMQQPEQRWHDINVMECHDEAGFTLTHIAALLDCPAIVNHLVYVYRASPAVPEQRGALPMVTAAMYGCDKVLLLLAYHAHLGRYINTTTESGMSVLGALLERKGGRSAADRKVIAECLVRDGVIINSEERSWAQDDQLLCFTPLDKAIYSHERPTVDALLAAIAKHGSPEEMATWTEYVDKVTAEAQGIHYAYLQME